MELLLLLCGQDYSRQAQHQREGGSPAVMDNTQLELPHPTRSCISPREWEGICTMRSQVD